MDVQNFYMSSLGIVPDEITYIFGDNTNFLRTQCRISRGKPVCQNSFIRGDSLCGYGGLINNYQLRNPKVMWPKLLLEFLLSDDVLARNSNWITPYGGDKCKWDRLKSATFDEKRAITSKQYKIDA